MTVDAVVDAAKLVRSAQAQDPPPGLLGRGRFAPMPVDHGPPGSKLGIIGIDFEPPGHTLGVPRCNVEPNGPKPKTKADTAKARTPRRHEPVGTNRGRNVGNRQAKETKCGEMDGKESECPIVASKWGNGPYRTPWSKGAAALWTQRRNHAEDTVPQRRVTVRQWIV